MRAAKRERFALGGGSVVVDALFFFFFFFFFFLFFLSSVIRADALTRPSSHAAPWVVVHLALVLASPFGARFRTTSGPHPCRTTASVRCCVFFFFIFFSSGLLPSCFVTASVPLALWRTGISS